MLGPLGELIGWCIAGGGMLAICVAFIYVYIKDRKQSKKH